MKKYYRTLSKEKQNKIKELYNKKYKDSNLEASFKRLKIYSIAGYLFGIIFLVSSFVRDEAKTSSIVISIILFILATGYLIGIKLIKLKVLNDLALKNK